VAEQQRVERDALRAARGAAANLGRWLERDGAVVGDRLPSEAEHHVSLAEHAARSAGGVHLADVHARPPLPQLEVRAQRRALHRLPREAERAPARVLSVRAEVVEEAGHHRGRDQVADVLRVVQRLKRDPDAAPRLECGPARVACVDRRVDLQREEALARVRVRLHVDARDDADRHAQVVPSGGVADHRDRVLEPRRVPELQRLREVVVKGRVLHHQDGHVALVADVQHLGHVLDWRAVLANAHGDAVRDAVRVREDDDAPGREDLLIAQDEAGAGGFLLPLHLPGLRKVWTH